MKKNSVACCVLIDKSGSMASIKSDVIGGFNQFLEDQKKVSGECLVTLVAFDYGPFDQYNLERDGYQVIYDNVSINHVKLLDSTTYIPRGSTALIDSFSHLIDTFGEKLAKLPESERPEKILIVAITDGQENHSVKFKKEELKAKITHQQEKYNWQFVFLGANIDAFSEAESLGVLRNCTLNYSASSVGTAALFTSLSDNMTKYRCCTTPDAQYTFSQKDQDEQNKLMKEQDVC